MKLLPLAPLLGLLALASLPAQAQNAQQFLSSAQTSYIRGDMEAAKRDFQTVLKIDPRNQVAINYLRMIQVQEAKAPKGNDQEKQLAKVIIPKVEFREATLREALDYLKATVTKVSPGTPPVNFVVQLSDEQVQATRLTVSLTNVPFPEVLRYVGDLSNLKFDFEKYAIKVTPKGSAAAVPAPAQ